MTCTYLMAPCAVSHVWKSKDLITCLCVASGTGHIPTEVHPSMAHAQTRTEDMVKLHVQVSHTKLQLSGYTVTLRRQGQLSADRVTVRGNSWSLRRAKQLALNLLCFQRQGIEVVGRPATTTHCQLVHGHVACQQTLWVQHSQSPEKCRRGWRALSVRHQKINSETDKVNDNVLGHLLFETTPAAPQPAASCRVGKTPANKFCLRSTQRKFSHIDEL